MAAASDNYGVHTPPRADQHSHRCILVSIICRILLSRPTGQSLANNDPCGADHPLTKHLRLLISTSLAQATRNTYATGMKQFIRLCKTCQGPIVATLLFTFRDGNPLTPSSCHYHLHQLLSQAGYQRDHFNTHTFRIGAATSAAVVGASSQEIKRLGRWTSHAFVAYICPQPPDRAKLTNSQQVQTFPYPTTQTLAHSFFCIYQIISQSFV